MHWSQGWNVLDFLVLIFQAGDVAGLLSGAAALRALRVLRPLRLLNRVKSLQQLMAAMAASTKDFFNVMLLWMFCFLIFGILGVNMFAGQLYACTDDYPGNRLSYMSHCNPDEFPIKAPDSIVAGEIHCDPETRHRFAPPIDVRWECSGTFLRYDTSATDSYYTFKGDNNEILLPRAWTNPGGGQWSFDNFGNAFQALFEISSLEQWPSVAFAVIEARGVGLQPSHNFRPLNFVFFVAFLTVVTFMVLPIVIGMVVDNIKQKSGTMLYTDLQNNWRRFRLKIQVRVLYV